MHGQRGVRSGPDSHSEWRREIVGSSFVFSGWKFRRTAETWKRGSVCLEEVGDSCDSGAIGRACAISQRVDGDTGTGADNVVVILCLANSGGGYKMLRKAPPLQK